MIEAPTATEKVIIKDGTFCEQEESGLQHVYRNISGLRVPSATQTLAFVGLVDFSRVAPDVLQRKRLIGIAVHAACEYIDSPEKGELDWDTVDPAVVPFVIAYENFCSDMRFKAEVTEEASVFTAFGMQFGCRIDARGTLGDGIPAIVERKCAYKEEISWPLQLAAQELVSPKLDPAKIKYKNYLKLAVQLKKNGQYKICGPYEKPTDQRHFLSALSLTWLKMNSHMQLPNIPDDMGVDEDES